MERGVFPVYTRCTDPSREEEFNRWYTHTHLPDLSKAKGFVRARRFAGRDNDGAVTYLALYEFESEDIRASYRELLTLALQAFAAGRHIDCITGATFPLPPIFLEIDPDSLKPLEQLDYPREVPEAMRARIEATLERIGAKPC